MTDHFNESILIVDDQPSNLAVLSDLLEPPGYDLLSATTASDAIRIAEKAMPDLVLLDILMPDTDGLETCRQLKNNLTTQSIPVIFITGRSEVAARIDGFRAGGVDYIVKPFEAEEVLARIRNHLDLAASRRKLEEKNRELAARLADLRAEVKRREAAEAAQKEADERLAVLSDREARKWNVSGLVGRSRALTDLLREVERLQAFDRVGVLLVGESGTGKELVARALHTGSPRTDKPFIPVNCVAVPGELMESMFFGHVRGAFTGATGDRKGYFEIASGGTLFLDEIGDMPAALQAKLLRVLEDGRITPLGSGIEKQVDVRVIAATNANLEEKISSGAFRQDLYFRLARTSVRVPPLRERRHDIPLLAAHFLRVFSGEMNMQSPVLTSSAINRLLEHPFPGNVRELKNVIERALIDSGGSTIDAGHLQLGRTGLFPAKQPEPSDEKSAGQHRQPETDGTGLPLNLDQAEELLIQRALAQTGGNIAEAARILGINRSRIYRRMSQSPSA